MVPGAENAIELDLLWGQDCRRDVRLHTELVLGEHQVSRFLKLFFVVTDAAT